MRERRLPLRHDTKRDRFARLVSVLMVLNAHPDGIAVETLAAATDVSRRQAYRDLHALEDETEIPLWNDKGRWGIMQAALLPSLSLTVHEALAFFVAARLLAKAIDEQDADFTSAFLKLAAVLPSRLHAHVVDALDQLAGGRADPGFRRTVQALTQGWIDGRVVQFEYRPTADGTWETRQVRPYLIEPSGLTRGLYLVGHDEERGATRTFKIERIRDVSVMPGRFEPPEDFRAGSVLAAAWDVIGDQEPLEVVLRFAPSVAARVAEARWHRSQALEPQDDGSLVWRATIAGPHEIAVWVLGWGEDVEVVAPRALRATIAERLERATATYRLAGQSARGGGQSNRCRTVASPAEPPRAHPRKGIPR